MSYFLFGLIDLERARTPSIDVALTGQRVFPGIVVQMGARAESTVLTEMRGGPSAADSIPFLITKFAHEDTSDALISPYANRLDDIKHAVQTVSDWVRFIIASGDTVRIRLWMTEGYDDEFECVQLDADRLADVVVARIDAEGDIPSLRIDIDKSSGLNGGYAHE